MKKNSLAKQIIESIQEDIKKGFDTNRFKVTLASMIKEILGESQE